MNSASKLAASVRCAVESLEARSLMSVTLDPGTHVLTATGTAGNDTITVGLDGGTGKIKVTDNGVVHLYAPANVGYIVLRGLGGNDTLKSSDAVTKGTTINGGTGNDTIRGGGGVDVLNGDEDNDTIDGGAGGDFVNGGAGYDTADYSARAVPLKLTLDGVANDGAGGEGDRLSNDLEVVKGGSAADYIVGNANANVLYGNGGADTIQGLAGTDVIYGGAGDDLLDGGRLGNVPADDTGDDAVYGEAGNDTLHASDWGNNYLNGGDGNDSLNAYWGNDTLVGMGGNDVLSGYKGNDTLIGGDGNDRLVCGEGADNMFGGNGTDTVDYTDHTGAIGVVVTLDDVANDGTWFIVSESDNAHSDIENVWGTEKNDTITGSSAANVLEGRGGNDVLNGAGGNDVVRGGDGNDTLRGGAGNDTLYGDAGDDFLDAENGSVYESDAFWGGSGRDTVSYASRSVGVRIQLDDVANDGFTDGTHGPGVELDNVHSDIEVAVGTSGADGLYGNAFANELIGGDGNDYIDGAGGLDIMRGGNGNDMIFAQDGNYFETVDGGAGDDWAWIDHVLFLSDSTSGIEHLG